MRIRTILPALLAPALIGAEPPPSEIVVTGQALSEDEAAAKAAAYVDAVGIVSTVKPAARWIVPVCPKIVGLADNKIAARIEARIRSVAQEIGARTAKPGCRRNFVVVFTANAEATARDINKANPRLMAQISTSWRGKLTGGGAPISWWYLSDVRNSDGMAAVSTPLPWMQYDGDATMANGGISAPDNGGDSSGGFNSSTRASIVSTGYKRSIVAANVLIDATRATGKDIDAVSDFAAMVGLAEIRFVNPPPPDSILSLFSGENGVDHLAAADLALLKALYRLPLDRKGAYHRGVLRKGIGEALTKAPQGNGR